MIVIATDQPKPVLYVATILSSTRPASATDRPSTSQFATKRQAAVDRYNSGRRIWPFRSFPWRLSAPGPISSARPTRSTEAIPRRRAWPTRGKTPLPAPARPAGSSHLATARRVVTVLPTATDLCAAAPDPPERLSSPGHTTATSQLQAFQRDPSRGHATSLFTGEARPGDRPDRNWSLQSHATDRAPPTRATNQCAPLPTIPRRRPMLSLATTSRLIRSAPPTSRRQARPDPASPERRSVPRRAAPRRRTTPNQARALRRSRPSPDYPARRAKPSLPNPGRQAHPGPPIPWRQATPPQARGPPGGRGLYCPAIPGISFRGQRKRPGRACDSPGQPTLASKGPDQRFRAERIPEC